MTNLDRSEINRALAKAIAYKQCGKDKDAAMWAAKLVTLLGAAEIMAPQYQRAMEAIAFGTEG